MMLRLIGSNIPYARDWWRLGRGLLTPLGIVHSLYFVSCFGSYLGRRPETPLLRLVADVNIVHSFQQYGETGYGGVSIEETHLAYRNPSLITPL